MPIGLGLFLGRRLGDLIYYFDFKHKSIAYANIKTAFGQNLSMAQIKRIAHDFYRAFGQNLIEIFFIPLINKDFMNKYVSFEGREFIKESFKKQKGVIFLAVHAGSWELSNIICANLGFPFSVIVRDQKLPRLNKLLNSYRQAKGCKIIGRENQIHQIIRALKNNEAIGLTLDQGGRAGTLVKFFGKDASMAIGAVKLALRYDSVILPAFYTRLKGPYIKVIIGRPFEIIKTGDDQKDVQENLTRLISMFEKYISMYPKEYLWTYKIWKYSRTRNILILNDGKAGHTRQTQALADMFCECLKDKNIQTHIDDVQVRFKNKFAKKCLALSSCLAAKYGCQGCLRCLKTFLEDSSYKSLISKKPDIIISCGSSIAPANFVLSRENLSKSLVIMRPSILNLRRFDLVVMPKHDNPPKRRNVVTTEGALNLIDEKYLKEQSERLLQAIGYRLQATCLPAGRAGNYLGLLVGGDTKNFLLNKDIILEVIRQIKTASQNLNTDILVTTSRRTSKEIESLIKDEFKDYSHCKLLIIANEKNIPEAVGGILGLAQIIIASPESISMISEAANSKKYVLVFESKGLDKKHRRFIEHFARNRYIYLLESSNLANKIEEIWLNKPQINILKDNFLVSEALKRLL
jgi:KDO2-lipid IV(A) lauroyltransferase